MIFGWWTRGSEATVAFVNAPQWVYRAQGHRNRVYPPRARTDDVWVMPGDLKDPDPALDTWEGEAT